MPSLKTAFRHPPSALHRLEAGTALLRQSIEGDSLPGALQHTWQLQNELRQLQERIVVEMRTGDAPATWGRIGDALCMTRQSAQERFGPACAAAPAGH